MANSNSIKIWSKVSNIYNLLEDQNFPILSNLLIGLSILIKVIESLLNTSLEMLIILVLFESYYK
jgi:hypothetical protein